MQFHCNGFRGKLENKKKSNTKENPPSKHQKYGPISPSTRHATSSNPTHPLIFGGQMNRRRGFWKPVSLPLKSSILSRHSGTPNALGWEAPNWLLWSAGFLNVMPRGPRPAMCTTFVCLCGIPACCLQSDRRPAEMNAGLWAGSATRGFALLWTNDCIAIVCVVWGRGEQWHEVDPPH
jgi:hypothetical protein